MGWRSPKFPPRGDAGSAALAMLRKPIGIDDWPLLRSQAEGLLVMNPADRSTRRCIRRRGSALAMFAAMAVVVAACGSESGARVIGTGHRASETRSLHRFSAIAVSNGFVVHVVSGSANTVVIEADDNVLPLVVANVNDDRLTLAIGGSVESQLPIHVSVTAAGPLGEITADTSASVAVDANVAPDLGVRLDSGAHLTISGQVTALHVHAAASAHAMLAALRAENVEVDLATSAIAEVHASSSVTGAVRQSASVTIYGAPRTVNVSQESSGSVVSG